MSLLFNISVHHVIALEVTTLAVIMMILIMMISMMMFDGDNVADVGMVAWSSLPLLALLYGANFSDQSLPQNQTKA